MVTSVARAPGGAPLATYDRDTVVLHWLTALLVVATWLLAQFIDDFPRGMPRTLARSTHIALGILVALVLVVRLAWRRGGGVRLEPQPGALGRLAVLVHYGLYVLLVLAVVVGIANVWVRGDDLFGIVTVPSFAPGDRRLRGVIGEVHEWIANALLVLAGLHAAAGLWHHWVLKDGVLRRMWPAR